MVSKHCEEWLIKNMSQYQDRLQMFEDCRKATGASIRPVQRAYKRLCSPQLNTSASIKIERGDVPVLHPPPTDVADLIAENVRLQKQVQRFMDRNRIERRSFREYARIENAVDSLSAELLEALKADPARGFCVGHRGPSKGAGIVHLSDLHFNELVQICGNTYDFTVAADRLYAYAETIIPVFKLYGVRNLLVAMTGDMLNSDRRLDEMMSKATNRAKAVMVSMHILKHFLLHLNRHFNVQVVYVTGNESRIQDEIGWTHEVVTDNYDTTLFNMLAAVFEDCNGIRFEYGNPVEQMVTVAGCNILLLHGHNLKASGLEAQIAQIVGRYSTKGVRIDYVLFGHLHSARLGDTYARSSSLVGSNAYSEHGLNLIGKASQNAFVVTESGQFHGFRVDLQTVGRHRYESLNTSVDAYNPKSAKKLQDGRVVVQVVV